ncbi:methyl-accepting chemotaxis protein [Escherichia coli]
MIPVRCWSKARETMNNIVNAVTRVTDIMGEIASASDEQSRGVDQVAWRFRKWIASRNRTHRWCRNQLPPPLRWKNRRVV